MSFLSKSALMSEDPKTFFQATIKAEAYKAYRRPIPEQFVKQIIEFLSKTFDPCECDAVDVACGSGQATFPLAPHLRHIVGIDVSQAQLDQIDKSSMPSNVHFQLGDSDHLPFEDSSLHLVNVKSALHWFDIPKFFQEVDRVLKPGGVLCVSIGGGRYSMDGYEEESGELFTNLERAHLKPEDNADISKLINMNYKDIEFPYSDIIRNDSYEEVCTVTVPDVIRLRTWMGQYYTIMDEDPEKAEKILQETQEKLMKLMGLDGKPEETHVKIKYSYSLVMCRKPM